MIALLGTGLLGSGFAHALLKKGNALKVWNRTSSKTAPLVAAGATACENPAEAVAGAERVHLVLKDDQSVDEVLALASGALVAGMTIIDHTTTSVQGARDRTVHWQEKGITYLHAPVFMGPQNALDSTGYMLVSGNQEVIGKLGTALEQMTGKLFNFGPEEGRAAGIKLAGNLFLICFTAGVSDMLALAKADGIPVSDLFELFSAWNPGSMIIPRMKRITGGEFDNPSWELAMARKDAGLMMNEADKNGVSLAVVPAIAAEMDKWIADGYGNSDWTVIGKNNVQ